MYEELFGKPIEQIVVLIACEDGNAQTYIKEKKDFVAPLTKQIEGFYKYYEELNLYYSGLDKKNLIACLKKISKK